VLLNELKIGFPSMTKKEGNWFNEFPKKRVLKKTRQEWHAFFVRKVLFPVTFSTKNKLLSSDEKINSPAVLFAPACGRAKP
jgi:hypothetical protein